MITAVNGGITLKGNELTSSEGGKQTNQQATLQLGDTISIESSESVNGKSNAADGIHTRC